MRNRQGATIGLAIVGCLLASGCTISKQLHRTFPLSEDGRIILDNATGGATITGWDYAEIKVDTKTTASNSTRLQAAEIRFDARPTTIRIWTDYVPVEGGSSGVGNPFASREPARVRYDLAIPRGASLERVRGSGPFRIDGVTGNIHATVTDGTLDVRLDRIEPGRMIRLEVQNGDIRLTLPESLDIRLEARAQDGAIRSMLGIPLRTALPDGSSVTNLDEIYGNGSSRVRLLAQDGNIDIRTATVR